MKVYLGLCVCTVHKNIGLQLLSLSCVQQEKAFNLSLKQKKLYHDNNDGCVPIKTHL